MGEIAEMMDEGILCCVCGVNLIHSADEQPCGHPEMCPACKRDAAKEKKDAER
jgi:hypothetical protein